MKREPPGARAKLEDGQRLAVVRRETLAVAPERQNDLRIAVGDRRIARDVMRHFAMAPRLDAASRVIGVLELPDEGTAERAGGLDDEPLAIFRLRRRGDQDEFHVAEFGFAAYATAHAATTPRHRQSARRDLRT